MNIEKAIEVLTQDLTCDFEGSNDDLVTALQLGIEALKYYQTTNVPPDHPGYVPLPGESEE